VFTGMPKKAKKNVPQAKNSPPRKQKSDSSPQDAGQSAPQQPGSNRFVNDLLTRGEAAELTEDGKLPQRATHIIQKKNPDGSVDVKRARFKLF
jgi:hypothetical protein